MPKAVIIGVGPDRGLGAQLCKRFAREGLEVVVAGRTQASLDAVVADIERAGGKASSFVAEATNEANVAALFDHAGTAMDLAIYNAGNKTAGRILEMEATGEEIGDRCTDGRDRCRISAVANAPTGFVRKRRTAVLIRRTVFVVLSRALLRNTDRAPRRPRGA
jgi:NAD(P)-dependent dehydrogenase (short-subunit alcohol dehydrogenase family)